MRIGINLPLKDENERPMTAAKLVERAKMVEAAGLDGLWFGGGGGTGTTRASSLMMLLIAAQATERLEVGTSIYVAANRHPFEMAHEFLSVESLVPGRFSIGVGAGSGPGGAIYGYDFENRFKRLHAHMATVRELCAGVPTYELSDPDFRQPRPERPARSFGTPGSGASLGTLVGGPRFILGAWHSQTSLRRAVRDYDGWMCSAGRTNFATMEEAIKRYRDLGGERAMVASCLFNLSAPTEKLNDDDSYYLYCQPDAAAERLQRLADLGFDDVLLVKADYPRRLGLYEADYTMDELEQVRSLLPRDDRSPLLSAHD